VEVSVVLSFYDINIQSVMLHLCILFLYLDFIKCNLHSECKNSAFSTSHILMILIIYFLLF